MRFIRIKKDKCVNINSIVFINSFIIGLQGSINAKLIDNSIIDLCYFELEESDQDIIEEVAEELMVGIATAISLYCSIEDIEVRVLNLNYESAVKAAIEKVKAKKQEDNSDEILKN